MSSPRLQQTLGRAAHVTGFGYWSGKDVRVEFHPAPPNTGIVFVRTDMGPTARVAATVENRIEVPRRTSLTSGGVSVEMVEHVLAALAGLRVDNCEVHVDRPEMPGCDGSSQPFVAAILEAGIVEQNWPVRQLILHDATRVGNEDSWVEIRPSRGASMRLRYRLDYGTDNCIGRQTIELQVTPQSFCRELASARTFLLQSEAEWLRSRGLGSRVTAQDVLVFGDTGPIDNELRFSDECVRHKALDLIGDLALAGCEVVGDVIAYRSGHRLNADLVRVLLSEGQVIEPRRKSA
jgi:UDP-3-O-[3-hydroxymyristoyl] N-acetylglucosamine deacetylase